MKTKNIIYTLCLGFIALASCDNDGDNLLIDKSQFVEPVFKQEMTQQNFVVDETNMPEAVGEWLWTKADFNVNSPISYRIETDTLPDFSTAKVLTSTTTQSLVITKGDVNRAAMLFSRDVKQQTMYFRLCSSLGTSAAGDKIYSQGESITFTTYYVMAIPEKLYMIGDDFGDWDWSSKEVVEMTPTYEDENTPAPGQFWTIKYLEQGKYIRWAPKKNASEEFGKIKNPNAGGVAVFEGDKATVSASGLYMIYFDISRETMIIEPAKVYGLGDAFGGWNANTYPFVADGDKLSITTTNEGNLRMHTTSSIAIKPEGGGIDWWRTEFNVIGGSIEYRGKGGDQTAVPVVAGQKVTLDFRTGKGSIQ